MVLSSGELSGDVAMLFESSQFIVDIMEPNNRKKLAVVVPADKGWNQVKLFKGNKIIIN